MTTRGAREQAEKERTRSEATNVHTEAAAVLTRLVEAVEAGELDASGFMCGYLVGARETLRTIRKTNV